MPRRENHAERPDECAQVCLERTSIPAVAAIDCSFRTCFLVCSVFRPPPVGGEAARGLA